MLSKLRPISLAYYKKHCRGALPNSLPGTPVEDGLECELMQEDPGNCGNMPITILSRYSRLCTEANRCESVLEPASSIPPWILLQVSA